MQKSDKIVREMNRCQMDIPEAFTPGPAAGGGGSTAGIEEKTTDYFDFVVSPPPHCANADGTVDEDSFLHRSGCRTTIGFLGDAHGFIKETNNNTLTALPPVSTITGSLGHIGHGLHRSARGAGCHGLGSTDPVGMDQSGQDCDYWVPDDAKEQSCNILLEDLNKYCWTSQPTATNDHHAGLLVQRRDSPLSDVHHRDCTSDDRQNTDGAIYTLTVLNSEANSMDGLECCKSPNPGTGGDAWNLRPSQLDLDAILNMESSVSIGGNADGTGVESGGGPSEHEHDQVRQVVVTANGTGVERYTTVTTSQYGQDEQSPFGQVAIKPEPGDNNNDWKLSDRNSLQESESAAESLLRNALQGKLYPGSVSTTRLLADGQGGAQQQNQDEPMHGCSDELLLSQLDVDAAYRATDYDKSLPGDVVDSYCNLEPVCNVSTATVMYTLDPTSGNLGTITLPADLASQVGTVTVVTASPTAQQDVLHQDTRHTEQQQSVTQRQTAAGNQLQLSGTTAGSGRAAGTKAPKKYVRRANRNSANGGAGAAGGANAAAGAGSAAQGSGATGGSPGGGATVQQRKERSLHYCNICNKGFKDKYSVNVHIRTHTGEKPFACSLCGKSFRQKAHLAKHYQTHVTQKPSVAAQAAAAAAATSSAVASGSASNSNGAASNNGNSNSNGPSSSNNTRSAPSPTAGELQANNAGAIVAQQQQQQQIAAVDSPIVAADCNPTS